jgi:hypothetical protein
MTTTVGRISRRIVNVKRHTLGYVVNGKSMTVRQVTQLASRGKVAGVQVVGNHVQARPGCRRLTRLPITIKS